MNLKPHAYKRWEGYGRKARPDRVPLHNDPATYRHRQVKGLWSGAAGKPSLKRAFESMAVDAKPRDRRPARMKVG